MSRKSYQVEYNRRKTGPDIPARAMLEILGRISREMSHATRNALLNIEWVPEGDGGQPGYDPGMPAFEAPVPPEFTEGTAVFDEVLHAVPIDGNSVHVSITDAGLPPEKCEKIAIDFARKVFSEITGEQVPENEVLVRGISGLAENVCEACLEKLDGLPFRCRACGRTFCREHRLPEKHDCQVNTAIRQPDSGPVNRGPAKTPAKSDSPRIVVRKIPCG